MNNEFKRMQKLAGVITESQYNKSLHENPNPEIDIEEIKDDK